MTDKINQTIEKLVSDGAPVRTLGPLRALFSWGTVTVATTLLLLSCSSLRPDLSEQMHAPLFLAEITTLFVLIIAAATSAIWLSFPDLRQRPFVVYAPLFPFIFYLGLMIFRATHADMTYVLPEDAHNDFKCALCISLYSLVPGFWMFRCLRRHATTYPRTAGALSLVTAASIGVLALKFLEGNDAIGHLITWHLIPVALIGVLGTFLGQRFLRW